MINEIFALTWLQIFMFALKAISAWCAVVFLMLLVVFTIRYLLENDDDR